MRSIVRLRQALIEQSGSAVSHLVVVAATLWLGLILPVSATMRRGNGMTAISMLRCATSAASAIFLFLEIDRPVSGLITVPASQSKHALCDSDASTTRLAQRLS